MSRSAQRDNISVGYVSLVSLDMRVLSAVQTNVAVIVG